MPQPRPPPPAWAWVVVEARPPVKASAASARAAILVLIDMRNSIRLWAAVAARVPSWTEPVRFRFDSPSGKNRLRPTGHAGRNGRPQPDGRSLFDSGSIRRRGNYENRTG